MLNLSENKRLERVRDVFILGCLTGMRYSDYKRIKRENVVNDVIRMREVKDKSKTLEIPLNMGKRNTRKIQLQSSCNIRAKISQIHQRGSQNSRFQQ